MSSLNQSTMTLILKNTSSNLLRAFFESTCSQGGASQEAGVLGHEDKVETTDQSSSKKLKQ